MANKKGVGLLLVGGLAAILGVSACPPQQHSGGTMGSSLEENVILEENDSSVPGIEDFLQTYLTDNAPDLSSSQVDLLKATVAHKGLIDSYVHQVGTDSALIAAQLYTETGRGPVLDTSRCSKAKACGSGQVKEIAFLETIYSLVGVPGGYNSSGQPKVKTLDPQKLQRDAESGNERYVLAASTVFADIEEETMETVELMIRESTDFSLRAFQERLGERKEQYVAAEEEYWEIVDAEKAYKNPRDDELLQDLQDLRHTQEADNTELRTALKQFWGQNIFGDGITQKNLITGRYALLGSVDAERWNTQLDFIGQLNMQREYAAFAGSNEPIDIDSQEVRDAIHDYNSDPAYFTVIKNRRETIASFLDAYGSLCAQSLHK